MRTISVGKVGILAAMVLSGCVVFALSSRTSPGGYVAMGTKQVSLATFTLTGDDQKQIVTEVVADIATNWTGGFTNYRLVAGGKDYGVAVISSTGTGATAVWSSPANPDGSRLIVPDRGTLDIEAVAEANNWSNVEATGLHTATSNISASVKLTKITFMGDKSGKLSNGLPSTVVQGNQFELLRTTITPEINKTIPLGGLTADSVVGVFDLCTDRSDYGYQKSMEASHAYSGLIVATGVTTVPVNIFDVATGSVVGKGTLPIVSGSSTEILLDQGPAMDGGPLGTPGLPIAGGACRSVILKANLAGSFTKATGAPASMYESQLIDGSWSDGTREGLSFSKDRRIATSLPLRAPTILL